MRRISFDYPHAAAKSLSNLLSTAEKPFHFVFCSGGLVEPDQGKGLWFLEKLRHLGVGILIRFFPRLAFLLIRLRRW